MTLGSETAVKLKRKPGFIQGLVLIALAWVAAAAAVALGPVLPTMAQVFRDVPGIDLKIPLVATGPALMVAILAIPYGYLADKIGRRPLLVVTLFVYGAAGLAPLMLQSLDAIVVSRMMVGLAEAAIMTCGTALIGDYFHGHRRERWLAAQTGTASLAGVVLTALGGVLGGTFGWRGPFYIYVWGWILIPLVLLFIWEPESDRGKVQNESTTEEAQATFKWGKPIWIGIVAVLSMMAFILTVVQFSFLVTERGMSSPAEIGLWSAFVTLGLPVGSIIFGVRKGRTPGNLMTAYGTMSAGFAVMALVPTVVAAIAGGLIANIGAGIVLPTLLTWLMATMPPRLRGRGAGLWSSASFLGQFLGPIAVVYLIKVTGSLSHAILGAAIACAFACLLTLPSMMTPSDRSRPGLP